MMRLKIGIVVATSLVVGCLSLPAQTNIGSAVVYSLDQFGPVTTSADAEKTFQKASQDIIAAGGGVIMIPAQTFSAWRPVNTSQEQIRLPAAPAPATRWLSAPGVTVIDARTGTMKIDPPQATGLEFNRVLNIPQGESLGFWGTYPIISMRNTILHGSTSYRECLTEGTEAAKDQKCYVPTIRGIFPGMFVSTSAGPIERLYVKSLGYDKAKKSWYFVADTDAEIGTNNLLGNKNHVNVLKMETFSHAENQTFDVMMWRHNYSQGDNYLFDARFKYQSDVHSTGGDENGVIYAAFVEAELGIFQGKVESWNAAKGELKYKESPSLGKTLGSGRPIINLNPVKWITNGTVCVVRPASWTDYTSVLANPVFQGKSYPTGIDPTTHRLKMGGVIRLSADAPVTDDAVGRYFAIDEPDEYVPRTTNRRWYLVDSVKKNADGTKDLQIIRHWWGALPAGSPTLYKEDNYSADGHVKPLKYVIAPGANAYDVSDGVNNPKSIIRIVPTPFTGTSVDFAANDPIEQAIGSDPFKPIPFRSWVWDAVPGAFPSPVFDIANNGIMRDSLLLVHGGSTGNYEKDTATHYDRNPAWDKVITIDSTCNTGLRFGADVGSAAILFAQPNNRVQPIKWYYGETNQPAKVASLTVSRDTGDFNFTGGLVTSAGLSGGDKPARNLRGLNVAVPAGSKELAVKFPQPEADNAYMAVLQLSWLTNHAIVKRTAEGFIVQFATPPAANGEISWLLVR